MPVTLPVTGPYTAKDQRKTNLEDALESGELTIDEVAQIIHDLCHRS